MAATDVNSIGEVPVYQIFTRLSGPRYIGSAGVTPESTILRAGVARRTTVPADPGSVHNEGLMSRFRLPEKPGSKYITPQGEARLRAELEQLWRRERPLVTAAVAAAAAQGDRSENAEYTYGKKRLREIDRRVRFLRARLEGMVVVSQAPSERERVFFGARVRLEFDDGSSVAHRIVGPDEFDMAPEYISMDAPLARSMLGKRLDDQVSCAVAGGLRSFTIVAIDYD